MAAQLPDRIFLNGEFMSLYSNPLEQYWLRLGKTRPRFYPLPTCKRGYVASWELKNNQLFLKDLDGNFERRLLFFIKKPARYTLKKLFPKSDRKRVKASWFTGKLRIPLGKMTFYQPKGYDSRFEKEMIITIERGDVIKTVTLDYTRKSYVVNSDVIVKSPRVRQNPAGEAAMKK